ncbi:hypothetical protein SAMN05421867_101164 [Cellulomonas marina]|uniref:Uncharacterized protein n=1 Tax=Cellulomonas marina TaxID=988821 RepID=A0A1I0V4X9_9CELL|nr:hypothetical protein SAMN05421867_101164 [Cellulomonas marina]
MTRGRWTTGTGGPDGRAGRAGGRDPAEAVRGRLGP